MIVSIITVNYNNVDGLKRTLSSVRNFSHHSDLDVEFIVVDGESNDGSVSEIVNVSPKDYHMFKFISEPDSGIYDAMNKGIALLSMTSSYVLFMNSGDTFNGEASSLITKESLISDIVIYGISSTNEYGVEVPVRKIRTLKDIKSWPCFPHQSTFISTKYHKNNVYKLSYDILADYDFFCKAYLDGLNITIKKTVISDFSQGGVSNSTGHILKFISELKDIQLRHFGKYNRSIVVNFYFKYMLRRLPFHEPIERLIRRIIF
ncbi:hypothetical protein BCT61_17160 [Vibrio breoganii]|uniref:glycosyltransferase n=1 Tax=Vibrio breoganii TaxID=553239 RepID=UPI000C84FB67|nr:glycosyltransferase [Vibrio breoganii]PMM04229.1 hypothetical protein BCT61_17160 [Vibrio breoganii]